MLRLAPNGKAGGALNILCLGAHSDDIEIGCGGTLLRLLDNHPGSTVKWVVFSANELRAQEALASANHFLNAAGRRDVSVWQFRESYFPYLGATIKDRFEALREEIAPDLVFTHYRQDRHQDHRVISDLTWNTFRNHLILEYEVPKYDGDLSTPNLYVELPEGVAERKLELLLSHFATQQAKPWFDRDTFAGLMRLRGVEVHAPSRYAEGFYVRKVRV